VAVEALMDPLIVCGSLPTHVEKKAQLIKSKSLELRDEGQLKENSFKKGHLKKQLFQVLTWLLALIQ
jgi:hypothetical protein